MRKDEYMDMYYVIGYLYSDFDDDFILLTENNYKDYVIY